MSRVGDGGPSRPHTWPYTTSALPLLSPVPSTGRNKSTGFWELF